MVKINFIINMSSQNPEALFYLLCLHCRFTFGVLKMLLTYLTKEIRINLYFRTHYLNLVFGQLLIYQVMSSAKLGHNRSIKKFI